MIAAAQTLRPSQPFTAPDDRGAVFDAIGTAMASAEVYAATAANFATLRDARGLAYAIRSAAACLSTAAELLDEVKPAPRNGGRS
ncbi:hypothetical protein [Methylobacterium sp. Leaf85]|uniref:hypothetical protein n=1 Tax=Methylobacterium sp. Leaf85 TaxID=1736241 RepID=UPI000A4C189B|nr:hypothetical protein [Methylobacterium sp. Leaf85]